MPDENCAVPELYIDGVADVLDSRYALRWYDCPNSGRAKPVLYKNGKRITKRWEINYKAFSLEDPDGGNANTD
jgi:hypothetical protein